MDEQCSYALLWGMPYELFWNGPLSAFENYTTKAHLESLQKDRDAWSLGIYIMDAMAQILSSKAIYPKEPYLKKIEREENQTQEDKLINLYKRLKGFGGSRKKRAPPE